MRPIRVVQSSVGASQAIVLDVNGRPEVSLQADVTGVATYSIQQTLDNVFDPTITPIWLDHPDSNLVGQTVDRQGNYAYIPFAVRVNLTAGAGSVALTVIQSGLGKS